MLRAAVACAAAKVLGLTCPELACGCAGDVWHIALPGCDSSLLYGYRVSGPNQKSNQPSAAGQKFDDVSSRLIQHLFCMSLLLHNQTLDLSALPITFLVLGDADRLRVCLSGRPITPYKPASMSLRWDLCCLTGCVQGASMVY